MSHQVRVVGPGQMEAPAGDIPFLLLPGRGLFAHRAERLRHLAAKHLLGDYLNFLARLAEAQQNALEGFPPPPLSATKDLALCREHGTPPLAARSWPRDPAWRAGLTALLGQLQEAALPEATRTTVAALLETPGPRLEAMANRVLAGNLAGLSPGEWPFLAAALQVYWTRMASELKAGAIGRLEEGGICPVCGSSPVAGVVRSGGAEQGLRYLCCSLCASQWHMVRLKCSSCGTTEGIDYFTLEGSGGAVKAESCNGCGNYLKLFYLEKDTRMEPMADDLATLTLDILMDDAGKRRGGPNLYFHPGVT